MRIRMILSALLLCFAAIGCSIELPSSSSPESVFKRYTEANRSSDWETSYHCLTPASQRQMFQFIAARARSFEPRRAGEVLATIEQGSSPEDWAGAYAELRKIVSAHRTIPAAADGTSTITDVQINGGHATAKTSGEGGGRTYQGTTHFEKIDGEWKVQLMGVPSLQLSPGLAMPDSPGPAGVRGQQVGRVNASQPGSSPDEPARFAITGARAVSADGGRIEIDYQLESGKMRGMYTIVARSQVLKPNGVPLVVETDVDTDPKRTTGTMTAVSRRFVPDFFPAEVFVRNLASRVSGREVVMTSTRGETVSDTVTIAARTELSPGNAQVELTNARVTTANEREGRVGADYRFTTDRIFRADSDYFYVLRSANGEESSGVLTGEQGRLDLPVRNDQGPWELVIETRRRDRATGKIVERTPVSHVARVAISQPATEGDSSFRVVEKRRPVDAGEHGPLPTFTLTRVVARYEAPDWIVRVDFNFDPGLSRDEFERLPATRKQQLQQWIPEFAILWQTGEGTVETIPIEPRSPQRFRVRSPRRATSHTVGFRLTQKQSSQPPRTFAASDKYAVELRDRREP